MNPNPAVNLNHVNMIRAKYSSPGSTSDTQGDDTDIIVSDDQTARVLAVDETDDGIPLHEAPGVSSVHQEVSRPSKPRHSRTSLFERSPVKGYFHQPTVYSSDSEDVEAAELNRASQSRSSVVSATSTLTAWSTNCSSAFRRTRTRGSVASTRSSASDKTLTNEEGTVSEKPRRRDGSETRHKRREGKVEAADENVVDTVGTSPGSVTMDPTMVAQKVLAETFPQRMALEHMQRASLQHLAHKQSVEGHSDDPNATLDYGVSSTSDHVTSKPLIGKPKILSTAKFSNPTRSLNDEIIETQLNKLTNDLDSGAPLTLNDDLTSTTTLSSSTLSVSPDNTRQNSPDTDPGKHHALPSSVKTGKPPIATKPKMVKFREDTYIKQTDDVVSSPSTTAGICNEAESNAWYDSESNMVSDSEKIPSSPLKNKKSPSVSTGPGIVSSRVNGYLQKIDGSSVSESGDSARQAQLKKLGHSATSGFSRYVSPKAYQPPPPYPGKSKLVVSAFHTVHKSQDNPLTSKHNDSLTSVKGHDDSFNSGQGHNDSFDASKAWYDSDSKDSDCSAFSSSKLPGGWSYNDRIRAGVQNPAPFYMGENIDDSNPNSLEKTNNTVLQNSYPSPNRVEVVTAASKLGYHDNHNKPHGYHSNKSQNMSTSLYRSQNLNHSNHVYENLPVPTRQNHASSVVNSPRNTVNTYRNNHDAVENTPRNTGNTYRNNHDTTVNSPGNVTSTYRQHHASNVVNSPMNTESIYRQNHDMVVNSPENTASMHSFNHDSTAMNSHSFNHDSSIQSTPESSASNFRQIFDNTTQAAEAMDREISVQSQDQSRLRELTMKMYGSRSSQRSIESIRLSQRGKNGDTAEVISTSVLQSSKC